MSKLQLKNLTKEEAEEFVRIREKYADHDRIDLLIHKTLKSLGVPKEEFLNRKTNKTKKKQVVLETAPQEIMFCTTDTCEINVQSMQMPKHG